jgi:hypothetical protein
MKASAAAIGAACALAVIGSLLPGAGLCDGEGRDHGGAAPVPLAFRLHAYIQPVGIATYLSLWITFLLGLLKFKFRAQRIDMRWHYGVAILTVVLATAHLVLVELVEHL